MSEIPNVATAADSAVTTRFETVEIRGVEACDDGSWDVTVNVQGIKSAPECQKAQESTEPDTSATDESDDVTKSADTREGDETTENPQTAWESADWNTMQKMAREVEEKTDNSRPEERTKDSLADWFESLGITPEDGGLAYTPDAGGPNEDAEDDTESDTTGEDSGVEAYSVENWEHPDHFEDRDEYPQKANYIAHFGICAAEGCEFGANGENKDLCKRHSDEGKEDSGETRDTSDRGDEVQRVSKTYDVSPKKAEKAVDACEAGDFEGVPEAVRFFA